MRDGRVYVAVCNAIFWFSFYIYAPYLTPDLLALGLSSSIVGVIVAAHAVVQMVVRFPMGIAAGKRGTHKATIIGGMIASAAAGFIMFFWPNPVMILIGNAVSGYASASYIGFTVLYGTCYPQDRQDKAMGRLGIATSLGTLAAFFVGGVLYEDGKGIRMVFLAGALAATIGLLCSAFIRDNRMPLDSGRTEAMRAVMTNRRLLLSGVLCICLKLVIFGTAFSFTPKLAEDIGAKGVELGAINATFMAASVLSSWLITTKPGRRLGDAGISALGFILLIVYCSSLTFVKSIPIFFVIQFLGGLSFSSLTAIFVANAVRGLSPAEKSAGTGLYEALDSLGSVLGPIFIGCFTDLFSYTGAFLLAACVAGAGVILSLYAGKKGLMPEGIRQNR